MAVRARKRGAAQEIRLPSDANRDLGIFLLFLGFVASMPLYALFERLIRRDQDVDWYLGALGGFVIVLIGFFLVYGSRKVIRIEPDRITVKDGLLKPALRYGWKSEPAVRLQSVEEERGGHPIELWLVNLVDGKVQYTLDRRPEQQMESRSLSEAVAKAIGCAVIEKLDSGETIVLDRKDLDLPFVERVRKHPELLGRRHERPDSTEVEFQDGEEKRFAWRLMSTGLLFEVLSLFGFLLLAAFIPMPVDNNRRISMFDLARYDGDYLYFLAIGALFLFALLILLGYRSEIVGQRDRLVSRSRLWGLPLRNQSIPAGELEEISARLSSRGPYVQFISDARIITERLSDLPTANWVAYRLRRFYAPEDLEEAPETVEMPLPERLREA